MLFRPFLIRFFLIRLIGVIEYVDENRNQKESVLSMCFALNDYLIIATECNNYYVKLNESVLLIKNETNERIDVDMSNQEAINFLTSVPEDRKRKKHKAEIIYVENKSDFDSTFQGSFIANKIVSYRNFISKKKF